MKVLVIDADGAPISLAPQYSTDGANFFDASVVPGSGPLVSLASSAQGVLDSFSWDALRDVGAVNFGSVFFRATPTGPGGTGFTTILGPFALELNAPPRATLATPAGLVTSSPVWMQYTLFDAESTPADVSASVSFDGGASFSPATLSSGATETTSVLAATPGGTAHAFAWDAAADFAAAGLAPASQSVVFALRPHEGASAPVGGGQSAATAPFAVDLRGVPSGSILSTSGSSGEIVVSYTLFAPAAATATARFEFDGGSGFRAATPAPGTDPLGALAATPAGAPHTFVWETGVDLPRQAVLATLRVTPAIFREGPAATTAIAVANDVAPVISVEPVAGPASRDVPVVFRIADPSGGRYSISAFFTLDGTTFVTATASAGSETSNLASSSAGTAHNFVWSSLADAPGAVTGATRVKLVIVGTGGVALTNAFALNNDFNADPVATIATPAGLQTASPISIAYTLADVEGDAADVAVSASFDGGTTFRPATLASGAPEGVAGLVTSPGGTSHVFSWDAAADLAAAGIPASSTVVVALVPHEGTDPLRDFGAPVRTGLFAVDPRPIPSARIVSASGSSGEITIAYACSSGTRCRRRRPRSRRASSSPRACSLPKASSSARTAGSSSPTRGTTACASTAPTSAPSSTSRRARAARRSSSRRAAPCSPTISSPSPRAARTRLRSGTRPRRSPRRRPPTSRSPARLPSGGRS